jgi:hypothetical protein
MDSSPRRHQGTKNTDFFRSPPLNCVSGPGRRAVGQLASLLSLESVPSRPDKEFCPAGTTCPTVFREGPGWLGSAYSRPPVFAAVPLLWPRRGRGSGVVGPPQPVGTCQPSRPIESGRSYPDPTEGVGSPILRVTVLSKIRDPTRPLVKTPSGASTEKCRAEGGWGRRLRRPQCFSLSGGEPKTVRPQPPYILR